jgi:hypothetical protein
MNFLSEETEVFSFEELAKYAPGGYKTAYLERTLPTLGMGSSRKAFDLGDGRVIKASLNDKGTVQNETEYNLYHSVPAKVKAVLAGVDNLHDPDFEWIIMDKVEPLEDEDAFQKKLGLTPEMSNRLFNDFCYTAKSIEGLRADIQRNVDYYQDMQDRSWEQEKARQSKFKPSFRVDPRIETHKKLLGFTDDFANLCMAVPYLESNGGDLGRLGQLGINREGHVVILDYGFGQSSFHMYNPSIYQQVAMQNRIDNDQDYYDQENAPEVDKYGYPIKKPAARTTTAPAPQRSQPERDDDYIPF